MGSATRAVNARGEHKEPPARDSAAASFLAVGERAGAALS